MDLSLAHTILGNRDHAIRCARIALQLSPDNRFVLRSATRCLLHWHDPEQAHAIIRSSERTLHDPWLLAAEVAVASTRDRKSRNIRRAKIMLSDADNAQSSLSELAAAVGNHEVRHGSPKKASQLFSQSLEDPTENAVAQVRWEISERADLRVRASDVKDIPRLYEARARDDFNNGLWSDTFENATLWLADQPFSSAPSLLGAYCLHLMGRDDAASTLVAKAKDANPGEPNVLNALLYYQIIAGDLESARLTFRELDGLTDKYTSSEALVICATTGLLQYREGSPVIGRILYEQAIKKAKRDGRRDLIASALANMAREEILQGEIEFAIGALAEAKDTLSGLRYPKAPEAEIMLAQRHLRSG